MDNAAGYLVFAGRWFGVEDDLKEEQGIRLEEEKGARPGFQSNGWDKIELY